MLFRSKAAGCATVTKAERKEKTEETPLLYDLTTLQKVHSTAAVQIENREKVLEGALQECLEEIEYKALPAALVDHVTVDVAGMKVGDVIRVKDLEISKNPDVDIHTDPEAIVVMVDAIRNSIPEDEEADEEAAEE